MYLIPIHVPIYTDGERRLVTTEWKRSLVLLRDSLGGRFGPVRVLAPRLPADEVVSQVLEPVSPSNDGIELVPSFDFRCRARHYWLRERSNWRAQVRSEVAGADVVHAGLDDVYRPISFSGFLEGVRQTKPTVFVQDTDIALQHREMAAGADLRRVIKSELYARIYELMCRRGVRSADLSLLKGSTLLRRYGGHARNARNFHDTSHLSSDVVNRTVVIDRLESLMRGRPLRLVYCGRLVKRKGVDDSVRIVGLARDLGADVEFDIIGDGSERATLEALIDSLGLVGRVRMLGQLPYGRELLRRLTDYDGILFTPQAEDTPRMIFDGYAAGLPLLAYSIEYVKERHTEDQTVALLPRDDPRGAAERVFGLSRTPEHLAMLTEKAIQAADYHSADNWYRRRAEWTIEAVEAAKTRRR
jgi:glycosyltransferase involved in cell wall biosynthesis